jgi:hypothetical protein
VAHNLKEMMAAYFRCPENSVTLHPGNLPDAASGFFSFGKDVLCYGKARHTCRTAAPLQALYDASRDVSLHDGTLDLPFDPTEVISNLREEHYVPNHTPAAQRAFRRVLHAAYYAVRPVLTIPARRHLQKLALSDWRDISFPRWPVETAVDDLHRQLLLLQLTKVDSRPIPFIWFWPEGAEACAIVTHDVETQSGVEACSDVMDLNASFGIPASFQIIPERRYKVTDRYLDDLRSRGFEINVQDLNHDGHLFRDAETFRRRVPYINLYGFLYGATGFRSAVLYRNQEWYDLLNFEYDMSVPNVGHLDPQRGGCCTVMPYFVGKILELPVTTTQDYTLFHILNNYSIELWKRQIEIIRNAHGLISFIIHPDYIESRKPRSTYIALLEELAALRDSAKLWIALPGDVNRWWRQRSQMEIVQRDGCLRIAGPGSERARLAFARQVDGSLVYQFADQAPAQSAPVHSGETFQAAEALSHGAGVISASDRKNARLST